MLDNSRIVVGVTGGIAAYKAVDLVSQLVKAGAQVTVMMTEAATRFVAPLTFQTLAKRPILTDVFQGWTEEEQGHISISEEADAVVIAPATANTIAKLAMGLADDMLSVTVLATRAPVILAPAMNYRMYENVATQTNLTTLRERGFIVVPPGHGRLASGAVGIGRLANIRDIVGTLKLVMGRKGDLAGRKIVVTAGGTHEPLDPVRYLGNRSSGRMGYSLAEAALERGASVILISGPASLEPPVGANVINVSTALEMQEAVFRAVEGAAALIMAAAVADYRPEEAQAQKIKKGRDLVLRLVRNPDILGELHVDGLLKVGFAAETQDLVENARDKLSKKGLAMIVANDAVSSIGSESNQVVLIEASGRITELPRMTKAVVANRILDRVVALLDRAP